MATKRRAAKSTPLKGTARTKAKKKVTQGDSYVCGVCGLAVTVDEACGCVDACDIICCGKPIKARKTRVKAKTAK